MPDEPLEHRGASPVPPAGSGVEGTAEPRLDSGLERLFGLGGDEWALRARAAEAEVALGRLGPYELFEVLGRGGQGEVYRARQPGTGRSVALKRLAGLGPTPDPAASDRFRREVDALARLSHPNVLAVYAMEVIDGHSLLVTEYVPGVSIDRWADGVLGEGKAARAAVREVLEVFAKVCDGVAHAHQRGVIHLDIKPSNVLVIPAASDGVRASVARAAPKVVDFGVARMLHDRTGELAGAGRSWSASTFTGTPTYASPEQVTPGVAGRGIDTRSDVYSLGMLLARVLMGAASFGTTEREGGSPRIRRLGLPRECGWIVARATEPDPGRRYQSADAMANDLRAAVEGRVVAAAPASHLYALRKSIARHRWVVSVVATLLVALAGVTAWSLVSAARARAAERDNDVNFVRATKVYEYLLTLLQAPAPGEEGGSEITVRQALDAAVARDLPKIDQPNPSLDPWVEAALRKVIGTTYLRVGRYSEAGLHLRVASAIELAQGEFGELAYLATMVKVGQSLRSQGKLDEAEAVLRSVVARRRMMGADSRVPLAQALTSLGVTLRRKNKDDDAAACYREAIDLYAQAEGPESINVATLNQNVSVLLSRAGKHDEAERHARIAMNVFQKASPNGNDDLVGAMSVLGNVLWKRGDKSEGEALIRRSIEMDRGLSKDPRMSTAINLDTLASRLSEDGRYLEAAEALKPALTISETLNGRKAAWSLQSRARLARYLRRGGKPEDAEPLCAEVADEFSAAISPELRGPMGDVLVELAEIRAASGPDGAVAAQEAFLRAWDLRTGGATADRIALAQRIVAFYEANGTGLGKPEAAAQWRDTAKNLADAK